MTVLLDLEPALEARVAAQADARGLPVPQYLHDLVAQAVDSSPPDAPGWPPGFFDQTFGVLAHDPLARLPQGHAETREPLL